MQGNHTIVGPLPAPKEKENKMDNETEELVTDESTQEAARGWTTSLMDQLAKVGTIREQILSLIEVTEGLADPDSKDTHAKKINPEEFKKSLS